MKPIFACLLAGVVLLGLGCRTPRAPGGPPIEQTAFRPASFFAPIHFEEGRYPHLYSDRSYAVWVAPEVVAYKRDVAAAANGPVVDENQMDAFALAERFVVVECHTESAFADMGIAYDVVKFRQMTVYLETPAGEIVRPVQVLIDDHCDEVPERALRAFRRTNLLVFPKEDLWMPRRTGKGEPAYARLVIEGRGVRFAFEWEHVPLEEPYDWVPTRREAQHLTVMGYRELVDRTLKVNHLFH